MNQIQSEQINEIIGALAKAQAKIKNAVFNAVNPHFKNPYAKYEQLREVCVEPLSENGLALTHSLIFEEGKRVMITQISHTSGQWMRSYLHLPYPQIGETPQGVGAAITYGKRYTLAAILAMGIDDGTDDDGEEAEKPFRNEEKKPPEPPKTLSASQIKVLDGIIGDDMEFLNKVLSVHRKNSLKDMPADQFDLILEAARNR